MHDSGKRKEQTTGALSDPSHIDAAMELLSPYSLWRLSEWLGKGAKKYAPRNWEKGILFSVCVGKLQRHLQQYLMGKTDEPHLDAVGFWWHALTHYEKMIKLGVLPAGLNDLPQYEKQHDEPEQFDKFTIKKAQDPCKGWYIILNKAVGCCYSGAKFLQKDLTLQHNTGWDSNYGYGQAPGYYVDKNKAKTCIVAYNEKEYNVPTPWKIAYHNRCGWWVCLKALQTCYLHKDGQLHYDTGGGSWAGYNYGESPGYWPSKETAESALKRYLGKQK